jgi:nucleoid-associated protein YgaU
MKKIIFKDTKKNTELILPVTPPSFEVSHGINIETVNINTLGDVALAGYGTLPTFKVNCMFPAREYPFNQPSAELDPYVYVNKFEAWCDSHTVLRFIVSETIVNAPVLISDISYGEKDGTGDVYATITMRKYRELSSVQTNNTGNSGRSIEKTTVATKNYTVKSGDTLGSICRKYYGDSSVSAKLASFNGIKNKNLIIANSTIKLPDKSLL